MGRLTGERRALAAAILAFYGFLFLIVSLQPPPGWGACFGGMAAVYGLGFFALVAGYFWARWYAIGLGISGLISAGVSLWQVGMEPVLLFYGGTHLGVSLVLWGAAMSSDFDGRPEWRERFHLDEGSTHRLGKAIMRVGVSLPYIVMYALAPRDDLDGALLIAAGTTLALAGAWALIRLRTWGLLAIGTGAAALGLTLPTTQVASQLSHTYALNLWLLGVGATFFLASALAPFAAPVARYLRAR